MRVGIYSRKSKYSESGDSIDNQISICKDYCRKIGSENIEFTVFEDEGWSGASINRPEMMKLIEYVDKKMLDYVVVYRLDRISRSVVDFSNLIDKMNSKGVYFISVKEQFDTSTPMGRAMMYISSVFAQLERETIAERIKDNMYKLAEQGVWLGGVAPRGYKSVKVEKDKAGGIEKSYYALEIDQDEIDCIELIYNEYCKEKSLSKVSRKLKELGYKGTVVGYISSSSVSCILRNTTYVKCDNDVLEYLQSKGIKVLGETDGVHGIMAYGKGREQSIYAIGRHCGCISSKLWLKVQKILDKNENRARLGTGKVGLIRGYLVCGKCNSNMALSYKVEENKVKHYYYVCSKKRRQGASSCRCKNINGTNIDNYILDELKKQTNSFEFENKEICIDKDVELIQKNIDSKEKSAKRLVGLISSLDGEAISNRLVEKLKEVDKEIVELRSSLENIKHNNSSIIQKSDSYEDDREYIESRVRCVIWNSDDTVNVHLRNNEIINMKL